MSLEFSPFRKKVCRWQAFTGQDASLEADERKFGEIAAERAPASDARDALSPSTQGSATGAA
jgi:hypothetical protein